MKVSVGQFAPSGDVRENIAVMHRLAEAAKAEGGQLVIFPEEAMFTIGQVPGDFAVAVDAGWSLFVQQLSLVAAQHSIAIIAGGYESSGDERPFNTLVAIAADGAIAGTYRKLHLFDAFSYQESKRIKPGDSGMAVVQLCDMSVGMMTCYDLRFPELARALVEQDVDLLAVPAAWFKGEHKIDHWETLLKARAIENTVWVAAAGSMISGCIGHSAVLDPMGVPLAFLNDEAEAVATAEVSTSRTEEIRQFLPVLRNRRLTSTREVTSAH